MSKKTINIILCGIGTVGGTLLEQIARQRGFVLKERGIDMKVVGVVDIFNIITPLNPPEAGTLTPSNLLAPFGGDGGGLATFREEFSKCQKSSLELIHDSVLKLRKEITGNVVFVDCTASYEIAALYQDFLNASVSVVCANKVAASGNYEAFRKLKETAVERGVSYNYETNVGAGLPVIHTIGDLVASGDRITAIEAVLSGTLNYIFNTISKEVHFSDAVKMAKENRFSEPDPRIDLSGIDVIRKLVILAREAGYEVSQDDVKKDLFVPQEYFNGTLDDFWQKLPKLDPYFEALRKEVVEHNQCLRFVARLKTPLNSPQRAECSVALEKVALDSPFAELEGSNNIVILHTERYNPHPMLIQGYGAGAGVTAAGVFGDILRTATFQ